MHSPAVSTKEIGGGPVLKVLSSQLEKIVRHFSRSSHVCPSHLCLALIVKVILETKWSWFGITFWAILAMIIAPLFLLSPFFWSQLPPVHAALEVLSDKVPCPPEREHRTQARIYTTTFGEDVTVKQTKVVFRAPLYPSLCTTSSLSQVLLALVT